MFDPVFDTPVANYEHRLSQDSNWAMNEGSRHFDEKSDVHTSLRRICKRLNDLGVPYAVAGGMGLFQHGFRRFTEVVDVLVSRQDLILGSPANTICTMSQSSLRMVNQNPDSEKG